MIGPVPDLVHMRPCASLVIRPPTWALKEVDYQLYHYVWNRSETERLQI